MTSAFGNFTGFSLGAYITPAEVQQVIARLPNINMTQDRILMLDNPLFTTQVVQCLYPVSGTYSPAQRIVFYLLSLASLVMREDIWIAGTTMGMAMVYSAVAAIHAILMTLVRNQLVPKAVEWVSIASGGTPKVPVWPITWDEDVDAVLAVVGVGFFLISPMMIWSSTFQRTKNKAVLFAWAFLMLIGLICAMFNQVYVDLRVISQFRFCSAGHNPPDIGTASGFGPYGHHHPDKSYNQSVWETFSDALLSPFPTCIYPCFDVSWPLRDPSSIVVIGSSGILPSTSSYIDGETGWRLVLLVYILITISLFICLAIFTAQNAGVFLYEKRGHVRILNSKDGKAPRWLRVLDYGAKILTTCSLFIFLAWIELMLWPYPSAESFGNVGQWGQVVGVGLVLLTALYDFLDPIAKWREWRHNPPDGTDQTVVIGKIDDRGSICSIEDIKPGKQN